MADKGPKAAQKTVAYLRVSTLDQVLCPDLFKSPGF